MADTKDINIEIDGANSQENETKEDTNNNNKSFANLQTPAPVKSATDSRNGSQMRLTRENTQTRLNRFLLANDAGKPMSIRFENMKAKVPIMPGSKELKTILHGVSGTIKSGEFVALMGPSGAGKSTLLNVLGARFEFEYSGQIYINDKPKTKDTKRKIGYVLQHDIILPNLTVRQTLTITAKLRLPKSFTNAEKEERVNDIIYLMGLNKCENTLVQLVSGGERKRLSIANEMLTNPSILFLDEPTSGLDSTSAYSILATLKELTKQGRTIICAIHQPSSQMYSKFDRLSLLASGKLIYFGDSKKAINYLSVCGYPSPLHYNPADFILELVTDNFSSEDESLQNKEDIKKHLIECWQNKIANKPIIPAKSSNNNNNDNSTTIDNELSIDPSTIDVELINNESLYIRTVNEHDKNNNNNTEDDKWPLNWFEQFEILLFRALKHRQGHAISISITLEMCSVALITGLIWWQMDKTEENLNDWLGSSFFIQVYILFMTMYRGLVHFPNEKSVIKRERQSGCYRLSSYYVSKLVAELPVDVALPVVAVTAVFWMVGYNEYFLQYFYYTLATTLGIATAGAFGTLIGCLMSSLENAMTMLAVLGIFMMLIGGFYVPENAMPIWISWLKYISFLRYDYLITTNVALTNIQFECSNPSNFDLCNINNNNYTGYLDKNGVLEWVGITEPLYLSIVLQVGSLILWHIIAYAFLRRSTSVKQT